MRNATAFLLALSFLALPACDSSGSDDGKEAVPIEGRWQTEIFDDDFGSGYVGFNFDRTDGSEVSGTAKLNCGGCEDEGSYPLEGTYDYPALEFSFAGTEEFDCTFSRSSGIMRCEWVNEGGLMLEVIRQ